MGYLEWGDQAQIGGTSEWTNLISGSWSSSVLSGSQDIGNYCGIRIQLKIIHIKQDYDANNLIYPIKGKLSLDVQYDYDGMYDTQKIRYPNYYLFDFPQVQANDSTSALDLSVHDDYTDLIELGFIEYSPYMISLYPTLEILSGTYYKSIQVEIYGIPKYYVDSGGT